MLVSIHYFMFKLILFDPSLIRTILCITALDKEMRTWDTYIQLEAAVKNMLTSLRAVGDLQNPAIRERHWQQLMMSTKVFYIIFFSWYFLNFSNFLVIMFGSLKMNHKELVNHSLRLPNIIETWTLFYFIHMEIVKYFL